MSDKMGKIILKFNVDLRVKAADLISVIVLHKFDSQTTKQVFNLLLSRIHTALLLPTDEVCAILFFDKSAIEAQPLLNDSS